MTPDRWQEINQLYQAALDLEASQRSAFLDRACAGDEELRREVESLLASHEQASKFIEAPALEVAAKEIAKKQTRSMIGSMIGSYKIVALLGAGGMGEVYKAKDTRLGREVAVKILPSVFSTDADRLRRFEQEARAAGKLNHPNVLAIYDFGIHDGSPYMVSELLEGETLRDRMKGTALPPRKAIEYALQIARGLAAAHEKGIVHRDLKPENLFITKDGRIKILDFGLAKLRPKFSAAADTAESTRTLETASGIVMGTAGYMSPEQVRGEETDHRSDLFSFGTILYEMLSGQRPFQGKSAVETMNAILKEEPPELSEKDLNIPLALEHLMRRCLEKTPEQRFQAASDLAFGLEELLGSTLPVASAAGQRRKRERLAWVVATFFLLVVTMALVVFHFRQAPSETGIMRFNVPPPQKATFAPQSPVAVSPDGHHLAFAATSEDKTLLWVRTLDSLLPRSLQGTEGAAFPFWSPDSRSIGFFAQGQLKRIEASGGQVLTLCNASGHFGAGTWNRDGVILFSTLFSVVLDRVSASGGSATPTTTLDPSRREQNHVWPQFLPDGRHFVYLATSSQGVSIGINVGSLDSKETKRILEADSNGVYAAPGYLLFVRGGLLLAQPFDAKRLEITGEPIPVLEPVHYKSGLRLLLSVSENGVLAYESGNPNRQLIWFDRVGRQVGSISEPGEYWDLELSPDNRRVAVEIADERANGYSDIWTIDLLHGIPTRLTFGPGSAIQPAWSPDGSHIVYASNQGGEDQMLQKVSNGAGNAELLVKGLGMASDWSSDGRFIVYELPDPKNQKYDLWVLPLFGDHKPFPFVQTKFDEDSGHFSPNGRWMAYVSNESGHGEVYVQSFPASGAKWQISTNGGSNPRWRRDGKELFYLAANKLANRLMAVAVNEEGGTFRAGVPKVLFQTRAIVTRYRYAVTADGQRFLVITPLEEATTSPITVVLNWTKELRR